MNKDSVKLVNFSNQSLNVLAQAQMDVKGKPTDVMLVAHLGALAEQGVNVPLLLADNPDITIEGRWNDEMAKGHGPEAIRYYLSPTIAKIAFEDRELDRDQTPVFEGRSQADMLNHLIKNAK